jgi:hypothetical protein
MILDAKQHPATQRPCQSPHEDRVDDVTDMQEASGGGGESGQRLVEA